MIELGSNIVFSGGCHIIARKLVKVGNDSTVSWGTLIMDTDSHKIYQNGIQINADREVVMEEHVWIGANCTLLKGSVISKGCIVAAGSVMAGKTEAERAIVSGSPIKILKSDISWHI